MRVKVYGEGLQIKVSGVRVRVMGLRLRFGARGSRLESGLWGLGLGG